MHDDKDDCREVLQSIYHFLDGELTPDSRAQIQQHLDDCPPCIEAFEFEAELRLLISRHCREQVPESLRRRVAEALEQEQGFPH